MSMSFRRGQHGYYIVFDNESEADQHKWLDKIFYRACFNGYMNAFVVYESYKEKEFEQNDDFSDADLAIARRRYEVVIKKLRDSWEAGKRNAVVYFETTGIMRKVSGMSDQAVEELRKFVNKECAMYGLRPIPRKVGIAPQLNVKMQTQEYIDRYTAAYVKVHGKSPTPFRVHGRIGIQELAPSGQWRRVMRKDMMLRITKLEELVKLQEAMKQKV